MICPLKSALFLKFSENFRIFTYFDVIFEILVKSCEHSTLDEFKQTRKLKGRPNRSDLYYLSINTLKNYVYAFDVECCERTGDDVGTLCAEVVGIENDVVAILVFESLLRFESLSENVSSNKR